MNLLERMARLIGADTSELEVSALLTSSYVKCAQRALQLHTHAGAAPNENSAVMLRELAQAEGEQGRRLTETMQGLGIEVPAPEAAASLGGTINHWGRVVQDLESHRQSVEEYREFAKQLSEHSPAVAGLLEQLCQEEYRHCARLRDVIARADPQALD